MTVLKALLAILVIACAGAVAAQETERVNINTADAQTIARVLNGVGLKKANAIVSYRETQGRFDQPADLAKVKGIGPATVTKNEGRIVIAESDGNSQARGNGNDEAAQSTAATDE